MEKAKSFRVSSFLSYLTPIFLDFKIHDQCFLSIHIFFITWKK